MKLSYEQFEKFINKQAIKVDIDVCMHGNENFRTYFLDLYS